MMVEMTTLTLAKQRCHSALGVAQLKLVGLTWLMEMQMMTFTKPRCHLAVGLAVSSKSQSLTGLGAAEAHAMNCSPKALLSPRLPEFQVEKLVHDDIGPAQTTHDPRVAFRYACFPTVPSQFLWEGDGGQGTYHHRRDPHLASQPSSAHTWSGVGTDVITSPMSRKSLLGEILALMICAILVLRPVPEAPRPIRAPVLFALCLSMFLSLI